MKTKYPRIFLATAALSILALPSAAQNLIIVPDPAVIDIEIQVQEIAVLTVVDQTASTIMNNHLPTIVGEANPFLPPVGMAKLQLATNFCVGVQFNFATVTGVRPFPSRFYGRALGQNTGNTLGLQPFARVGGTVASFGTLFDQSGSTTNAPFGMSDVSADGTKVA